MSWFGDAANGFMVAVKADAVHEVQFFGPEAVEALPDNGTRWPAEFMAGVVRREGQFMILIDLARIVRSDGDATPH